MIKSLPLKMMMALAVISTLFVARANAQGCIEIKSILVDACGTPEGENEMVRFDVGNSALNTSNMIIDWPNNNYIGLCQDATTASIISSINNLIVGCGSVAEPVGGVLPANSKVLIVTSTNINTILNSFANLNDNLIMLFQCNGNTSGHFANYNTAPGLRTLSIEFTGACIDSVTYDRTLLVNQFGVIGGMSFENDGALVQFTASGTPSYLNFGCQALSTGFSLTGGPDVAICPGGPSTVSLNGTALNLSGNVQWNGGTGSFNPPNALSTVYTPGPGETGLINITVTGSGPCNSTITDTVRVNIVTSMPSVSITSNVSGTYYSSFSDPGYFYNWYVAGSSTYINGQFSPTFTPNANGCYYMILSTIGGCTSTSNTLCITNVGIEDIKDNSFIAMLNNPGSEPSMILNSTSISGTVNLEILDIYGRLISRNPVTISNTITQISPDWSDIAGGIYVIRLSNKGWSVEGKAILVK
jgi:hypothetical protein